VFRNAQSYGIGVMERLIGWWWPARRIRRLLNSVSGLEHLQRARSEGRGVILLALHTTTMDIGATLLRLMQEIDFSYQPAANPVIDWVQRRGRSRPEIAPAGAGTAATAAIESGSIRAVIRHLQAGHVVWYAPDRDFGSAKSHVFAPFFGRPAATITATSRYARLTGARVVTLEYWRDAGGGYGLRFGEALADFPSGSDVDDCTRINAWIESVVRRHPEQYRWTHRRFRTRPPAPPAGDDRRPPLKRPAAAPPKAGGGPATSRVTAA
jgi:KDO2-lipid IV(A) lauroyltransferase